MRECGHRVSADKVIKKSLGSENNTLEEVDTEVLFLEFSRNEAFYLRMLRETK